MSSKKRKNKKPRLVPLKHNAGDEGDYDPIQKSEWLELDKAIMQQVRPFLREIKPMSCFHDFSRGFACTHCGIAARDFMSVNDRGTRMSENWSNDDQSKLDAFDWDGCEAFYRAVLDGKPVEYKSPRTNAWHPVQHLRQITQASRNELRIPEKHQIWIDLFMANRKVECFCPFTGQWLVIIHRAQFDQLADATSFRSETPPLYTAPLSTAPTSSDGIISDVIPMPVEPVKQWEYLIAPDGRKANKQGDDGWELVAIDRFGNWVFKRPLVKEKSC